MSQRLRASRLGYVVAIASVALAFAFRLFTAPIMADRAPFFPFGLAVLFAAWMGGLWPGLLATALGSIGGVYFFLLPLRHLGALHPGDVMAVIVFVVFSIVTTLLFEQVHRYRRSAIRTTGLLEQVHDAIFTWRRDGTVEYWNSAAEQLYGIPAIEARGRNIHELLRTVHERGMSTVLAHLDGSGEWFGELMHRARGGNLVDVSTRLVMLEEDRRGPIVLQVDRDISDRKQRETQENEARRLRTAVYELIERLQHARSAADVYEASLDAIRKALRCSRASILLFDASGVMRFAASAGLSEAYRRAVDGHSPWGAETRDAEPIVVPDVAAADLEPSLREVIRGEGIAALAFVPLVAQDRLIGKFMAYFDAPHEFSREEIETGVAIARELAFGVQRTNSEQLLRASEARLTGEAAALARLNELSAELWRRSTREDGLTAILEAALEILGSERGNVQLWNPKSESLRIASQRGFETEFLEFFRDVRADAGSVCGRSLASGGRTVIDDVEADPDLGSAKPVLRRAGVRAVQSTPLRRWDGTPLGMVSTHWSFPHRPSEQELRRLDLYLRTATDFIERCGADEALRREVGERQRAETGLQDRAEALQKATAALQENDRRKNEFLATLGHELRNPLAPLTTGLELMRRLGLSPDAEQVRAMMERQVGSMARLVDDLLDINRINTGRLRLQRERVSLSTVLQRAIETSRPLIQERAHRLAVAIADDGVLDADPTRLSQVFVALLNNAAQYTDLGGTIRLATRRDGDQLVVCVSDTGRGIAPAELPRIFEMFSRASSATQSGQAGLGIGLSLARSLLELHGATIEASSEGEGRGCEFLVRLPGAPAAEAAATLGTAAVPARGAAGLRVLVADDNRDAAESLALLLETLGSDVRTAFDGEQAALVASEFQPDVALLDIGMPTLDGYEAARRIRRESNGRRVRLIALTGYGQESDRLKSREAGFDWHLVKPLRPQALLDLLADLEKGDTLSPRTTR